MARTSCITYTKSSHIVMIREDLVRVCDSAPDKHCAAAILNEFIFWTDYRLGNSEQARQHNLAARNEGLSEDQDESLWIYMGYDQLKHEMMDAFGRNKIVQNSNWLVEEEMIFTRNNPKFKWDRTLQYKLNIELVQSLISNLPSFEIKRWKEPNQTMERLELNEQYHRKDIEKKEEKEIKTPQQKISELSGVVDVATPRAIAPTPIMGFDYGETSGEDSGTKNQPRSSKHIALRAIADVLYVNTTAADEARLNEKVSATIFSKKKKTAIEPRTVLSVLERYDSNIDFVRYFNLTLDKVQSKVLASKQEGKPMSKYAAKNLFLKIICDYASWEVWYADNRTDHTAIFNPAAMSDIIVPSEEE